MQRQKMPKVAVAAPIKVEVVAGDWVDEALVGLPPIVTVKEAIGVLRTSRRNFYRLLAAGKIEARRPADAGSSPHLIARSELARYLRGLVVE